jgi:hypothetical protein
VSRFGVSGPVTIAIWAAGAWCEPVDPEDLADPETEGNAIHARAMAGMLRGRRCVVCGDPARAALVARPYARPPGMKDLTPFWADLCPEHFRDLHLEQWRPGDGIA